MRGLWPKHFQCMYSLAYELYVQGKFISSSFATAVGIFRIIAVIVGKKFCGKTVRRDLRI